MGRCIVVTGLIMSVGMQKGGGECGYCVGRVWCGCGVRRRGSMACGV